MNTYTQEYRGHGFAIGLLTGTCVGAGLMMWLAPRMASELGQRYRQASTRVGDAVDALTRNGEDVRDEIADAVGRGAREVQRYATAAKTARVTEARKHSAADHSASKTPSL
jgi:gas vesicle protein